MASGITGDPKYIPVTPTCQEREYMDISGYQLNKNEVTSKINLKPSYLTQKAQIYETTITETIPCSVERKE